MQRSNQKQPLTLVRLLERAKLTPFKAVGLLLGAIVFWIPLLVDIPGLDDAGQRMFAIFCVAIVLFVTEAVPLYATGALIIVLQVLLLSDQALAPLAEPVGTSASFFSSLADPVVILFLGGFLIADGASKYKLDRNLASVVLTPFKDNARHALLALMLLTGVLSFFMSNTATAATMFAVLIPILASLPNNAARTGFALAIPLAANVGGLGTPVASPPNAIAVAQIAQRGGNISFLGWMLAMAPLILVILILGWLFLCWRFVPSGMKLDLNLKRNFVTRPAAIVFYVVAGLTILLWFTEPVHGMAAATVSFLAVVALLGSKVMTGDDLKALQWPVLWLVAGGIALGNGVGSSGLADWLVGLVAWEAVPSALVLLLLCVIAWAMGNTLSNSAAANLLIPLGLAMATSIGQTPLTIGLVLAGIASLGVMLPISTPPNAIAYATGTVKTSEMATVGLLVGIIGIVMLSLVMPWLWGVLGII